MLHTTRGILFQQIKYTDSSLIVKIFTEKLGLQSFIVKGVHSKRSRSKPALFQPLNLLNVVMDHKAGKSLQFIREISLEHHYQSVHTHVIKRSVLLFLNELLNKSIREETPNPSLFSWLFNALTWFDLSHRENLNFHLIFMLQFSKFLGFYPKKQAGREANYFDLEEGVFAMRRPEHPHYLSDEAAVGLASLMDLSFESGNEVRIGNLARRQLLEMLTVYYRLHLPGFGEMKSIEVLKTVLEE